MIADSTVEILREIRDGIGALTEDSNERLDQMDQRLDQSNERLGRIERGLSGLGTFMRKSH